MHSTVRPGSGPATLAHALAARAGRHGATVAVRYGDGADSWTELTYAQLYARAGAVAARLLAVRRPSDTHQLVLIALPSGPEYLVAFYGCLLAGATAVTLYLPGPLSSRATKAFGDRLGQILADCDPQVVVTSGTALDAAIGPALRSRVLIDADTFGSPSPVDGSVLARPDGLALLQYTSGSTGQPKGVLVSHANLRHNVSAIAACLRCAEGESVTSWLPLFHDLGLIGGVLQPLWAGMTVHLLSPAAFLRRPVRWLDTVSRTGSVLTMAPDFAYALAVRRVDEEQRTGLDLSRLRYAVTAAEPIRVATIDAFTKAFAPCGLRRQVMMPAYGLAENTLCVAAYPAPAEPVVFEVSAQRLAADGVAVPLSSGAVEPSVSLVGCGYDIAADSTAVVVDPAARVPLPDGTVGEIWVSGPSVGQGYWGRPAESEATFRAKLADDERRWLRTGDLGVRIDGVLCVIGRRGDVVIRQGRNHFLHDIEYTAGTGHPALEPGGAAAFTVADRLVLVHELHGVVAPADRPAVISAIRCAVLEAHGLRLDTVVLVRRGRVPKTTSGKTRRGACARLWSSDGLDPVAVSTVEGGSR